MSEAKQTLNVTLKSIEAVQVAALRHGEYVANPDFPKVIGPMWERLTDYLQSQQITPVGPGIGLYEGDADGATIEVALPVAGSPTGSDAITIRTLPAIEQAACFTLVGPYDGLGKAHTDLYGWVMANGYTITGPVREVYLVMDDNPAEFVTEIQYPVAKG